MKVHRKTSPILLFVVAPSLVWTLATSGNADHQSTDAQLHDGPKVPAQKNSAAAAVSVSSSFSNALKADVGTKDAPVDGLDGKPHAGPFVESLPDNRPGSSTKKTPKPEDGVMNDPNRASPRKGTTGIGGGVTEKERDRKAHEFKTGEKPLQKPDSPREPPPLPVGGQDKPTSEVFEELKKKAIGDMDSEKPKGAAGIEVSMCSSDRG